MSKAKQLIDLIDEVNKDYDDDLHAKKMVIHNKMKEIRDRYKSGTERSKMSKADQDSLAHMEKEIEQLNDRQDKIKSYD